MLQEHTLSILCKCLLSHCDILKRGTIWWCFHHSVGKNSTTLNQNMPQLGQKLCSATVSIRVTYRLDSVTKSATIIQKVFCAEWPSPQCTCSFQSVLTWEAVCNSPIWSSATALDMKCVLSQGSRTNANERRCTMKVVRQRGGEQGKEKGCLGGCVAGKQRLPEDKLNT